MVWVLVRKLLRDVRVAWFVVALLLFLFQLLWARITQRVTAQILPSFERLGVFADMIQNIVVDLKEMPGQMIQAVIGGDNIRIDHAEDMFSISYVHPLVLSILCLLAIGRAANAIAGEIDRGTMELLLAQPIRRTQVILAHLVVDAIVFPGLCLVLWTGTYCGTSWMGLQDAPRPSLRVDPFHFLPGLLSMLGLLFAVSGMTMWISSLGRSRARVWGWGVSLILAMFLINVLGQVWVDQLGWMRQLTIFYYYQPQLMILQENWYRNLASLQPLLVLGGIGVTGYFLAWATFCRRDLPAPL
jgi:ABC-2 type transport system permease protein